MERRVLDSRPVSTSSWQGGWSSTNVDKLELTRKSSLRVRSEATHREEMERRVLDSEIDSTSFLNNKELV